jgi:hypothetical protein
LRSGHGSLTPADIKPSRNLPTVRMRQTNDHACEDSSQLVPVGRRFYSVLVKYLKRQGFIRNSLQHFVRLPRFLTRTSTSVIIVDPRRRSVVNIRILVQVLVAKSISLLQQCQGGRLDPPRFQATASLLTIVFFSCPVGSRSVDLTNAAISNIWTTERKEVRQEAFFRNFYVVQIVPSQWIDNS